TRPCERAELADRTRSETLLLPTLGAHPLGGTLVKVLRIVAAAGLVAGMSMLAAGRIQPVDAQPPANPAPAPSLSTEPTPSPVPVPARLNPDPLHPTGS